MRRYNVKLANDDFTTPIDEATFLAVYHAKMINAYDTVTMTDGCYRLDLPAHAAYEAAYEAQMECAFRRRAQIIHRLNEQDERD